MKSLPKLFASDNGIAFAEYLMDEYVANENDPFLKDLIVYELGSLLTLLDNRERDVQISFNPNDVIPVLARGELPNRVDRANYNITIQPHKERMEFRNVFHS